MAEVKSNGNESFANGNAEFETSLREVEALSDEDLYDKLKASGKTVGPVVATTRKLYQKQLAVILSSPQGVAASPVSNGSNGTNGTAEANGDEGSDSDGSFETSSRASRSSRSSSMAKKSKASLRATPKSSAETFEDCVATETPTKKERFTSFATPARSPRTFEEYVAESEARRAKNQGASSSGSKEEFVDAKENGERATGFLGSIKLLLVIAVFAAIAAYAYIIYRDSKVDPDAAIDEEIEALRRTYLGGSPAPQ